MMKIVRQAKIFTPQTHSRVLIKFSNNEFKWTILTEK